MSKHYREICFYSHFGNGDLFNSREIIKDIINYDLADTYYYAHSKNRRMFSDISNLKHSKVHPFMLADKPFVIGQENDLYINTWIGRDGKYVLPGIGCTLTMYKEMFNEILRWLNLPLLSRDIRKYIPDIDYTYFQIDGVTDWVQKNVDKEVVLMCTGDAWSNQAVNFDFTPVVESLCDLYPKILFITTRRHNLIKGNLFYSGDITKTNDNFDLNEISFLSLFADTVIGRSSGPYVFTQVWTNVNKKDKAFLTFTKHINSSDLFKGLDISAQRYWSPATETDAVINNCRDVIERRRF